MGYIDFKFVKELNLIIIGNNEGLDIDTTINYIRLLITINYCNNYYNNIAYIHFISIFILIKLLLYNYSLKCEQYYSIIYLSNSLIYILET